MIDSGRQEPMIFVRPTGEKFDLATGPSVYLVEWLHACLIYGGDEKANPADPSGDVNLLLKELYNRADLDDIERARKADPHAVWAELSTDELQAECEQRQRELIELTNVIRNRIDHARAGVTRAAQIKPKAVDKLDIMSTDEG